MKKKRGGNFSKRNSKAQIWVETVIYTLIAFALIGLVLAFVKPRIEEIRDQNLIEQSVGVLDEIGSVITNMGAAGNQRVIELGISKGILSIDGENDKLFFEIESVYEYSQPGETINVGGVSVITQKKGEIYDVTLTKDYSGQYDITYETQDKLEELGRASTPYRILISNKGENPSGLTIINIGVTN